MFIPYKFLVNRFVAFSYRNFHNKFGGYGGRHELKTPAVRKINRKKAESRNSKEIGFDTPLSTVARNASVQVLSTGAYGMGRSVVLRTGNQMYLFNCGEGTQKILTDNGITLSQVDDFFITFNSWDNTGGIFAFFIHSSMSTNPSKEVLRCHGPSFVEKVKAMLVIASDKKRNFFPTCEQRGIKDLKFKDDQVTVEYVELLHAASDGKTPQLYDSWAFKKKVFNEIEGSNGIYETALNGKKTVMCYIIK
ncbi:zinc phosphodiesterase ELAC protein 2-like, partial [Ruditapes philippinarum]|uniref:zinc phosphodiesterase ELAC protein 2-like n=1 Tax=Ruditapes philippinarum TaxID=129788 RepID=UPI00295B4E54